MVFRDRELNVVFAFHLSLKYACAESSEGEKKLAFLFVYHSFGDFFFFLNG